MTKQQRISYVCFALMTRNIPYKWKGNSPLDGLDCSGFVCEVLRSVGLIGKEDYSAQMLYDKFKKNQSDLQEGSLLFFGKSETALTHVAIAIDDYLMVEAGGGDSTTDTLEKAIARNAYVRVRPISSRADKPIVRVV